MASALDWTFRDRATGRITVAQVPNLPLTLFIALRIVESVGVHAGVAKSVVHWAGSAALAWWAVDEVVRGVNPFRRALGLGALGYLVWTLFTGT